MEPKSFREASFDDRWVTTMTGEIAALESNLTRDIVDLPPGKQAIVSKWVFKIKHNADRSINTSTRQGW